MHSHTGHVDYYDGRPLRRWTVLGLPIRHDDIQKRRVVPALHKRKSIARLVTPRAAGSLHGVAATTIRQQLTKPNHRHSRCIWCCVIVPSLGTQCARQHDGSDPPLQRVAVAKGLQRGHHNGDSGGQLSLVFDIHSLNVPHNISLKVNCCRLCQSSNNSSERYNK